jgi:hypothetical protein
MKEKTKVYLASRYSRREELCGYRQELESRGFEITSRWLNGKHQISDVGVPIGDHGEKLVEGDDGNQSEEAQKLRMDFAREDVSDVLGAEIVICFTEPPRSSASRGGRHVEFGLALAKGKFVIVIGHRENLFCWLPEVAFFPTWEQFKESAWF